MADIQTQTQGGASAAKRPFDCSAWLGASFASDELESLKNVAEEVSREYMRRREERLWAAVLLLEGGRRPANEEVARRGRRLIWPNGKTEWMWDKTIILVEPGISERWRQDGGEAPNS